MKPFGNVFIKLVFLISTQFIELLNKMKISGRSWSKYFQNFHDYIDNNFWPIKALLVAAAYAGGVMKNQADESANQAVEATKPQAMDIARLVKRWWGGDEQAEKELEKRADQIVSSVFDFQYISLN